MQCHAKSKRSGQQCRRRAVRGRNVCQMHGGVTPRGFALPQTKTGEYSKDVPTRLIADYERTKDDPNTRQPDITRAQRLLGWEAKVSLEDGLQRTIDYFRALFAAGEA